MGKIEEIDRMLVSGNTDVADICSAVGTTRQVVYNRRKALKEILGTGNKLTANEKLERLAVNTIAAQREDDGVGRSEIVTLESVIVNRLGRQKISEAYKMMSEGNSDLDVAIAFGLNHDEVAHIRTDYLKMIDKPRLASVYYDLDSVCANLETRKNELESDVRSKEEEKDTLTTECTTLSGSRDKLKKEKDAQEELLQRTKQQVEATNKLYQDALTKIKELQESVDYGKIESKVREVVRKSLYPDLAFWIIPFYSTLMTLHDAPESAKIVLSDKNAINQILKKEQVIPIFAKVFERWMNEVLRLTESMALMELIQVHPYIQEPEITEMMTFLLTRNGTSIEEVVQKGIEEHKKFLSCRAAFDVSNLGPPTNN